MGTDWLRRELYPPVPRRCMKYRIVEGGDQEVYVYRLYVCKPCQSPPDPPGVVSRPGPRRVSSSPSNAARGIHSEVAS